MAVSFVTSGDVSNGSTNVTTMTATLNIGTPASNGALVIALYVGIQAALGSPTCTWNGVSMFVITSTGFTNAATNSGVLFGLINPASGSHSAVASWTGSGAAAMGFWSFAGADQAANSTTFINGKNFSSVANNTTFTQTVTTANGNGTVWTWSGGTGFSGTQTPVADWNDLSGFVLAQEGQHLLSTTTSDSYTMTMAASDGGSGAGCSVLASAAAGDTFANEMKLLAMSAVPMIMVPGFGFKQKRKLRTPPLRKVLRHDRPYR